MVRPKFFKDPIFRRRFLGTAKLFGIVGRANVVISVGLFAYDAVTIRICTVNCLKGPCGDAVQ